MGEHLTELQTKGWVVDVPYDKPDQLAALQGLSNSFGWSLRELDEQAAGNPIDAAKITQHELIGISRNLWGVTDYGRIAIGILDSEKDMANGISLYIQDGRISVGSHLAFRGSTLDRFTGDGGIPIEDGEPVGSRMIDILKNHNSFPFDLSVKMDAKREDTYRVSAETITRSSLAAYLQDRGYNDHRLTAGFGRAFDVLNVAAGTAEPKVTDTLVPEEFLPINKLFEMAAEEGLSRGVQSTMASKILSPHWGVLMEQVKTGTPPSTGEVAIEASSYKAIWSGDMVMDLTMGKLQIAWGSLANIAAFYGNYHTPAKAFLRELVQG